MIPLHYLTSCGYWDLYHCFLTYQVLRLTNFESKVPSLWRKLSLRNIKFYFSRMLKIYTTIFTLLRSFVH